MLLKLHVQFCFCVFFYLPVFFEQGHSYGGGRAMCCMLGPPLCEISGRLLLHVPLGYEAKMVKCPQANLVFCVFVWM